MKETHQTQRGEATTKVAQTSKSAVSRVSKPALHGCPTAHVPDYSTSELLLLPDGRILVHNLTPAFADLLRELNPDDEQIASRVRQFTQHATRNMSS